MSTPTHAPTQTTIHSEEVPVEASSSRILKIPVQSPFRISEASIAMRVVQLDIDRWNRGYDLVDTILSVPPSDPRVMDPTYLILKVHVRELVTHFQYLTIKQLRALAIAHRITHRLLNKPVLTALLIAHDCSLSCAQQLHIFKELPKQRAPWCISQQSPRPSFDQSPAKKTARAAERPQQRPQSESTIEKDYVVVQSGSHEMTRVHMHHLARAPTSDKDHIIREWQEQMTLTRFLRQCCAVCSELKFPGDIECLHSRTLPLHLLRNDDLPESLLPTSYNFHAYQRAILDPEGIQDRNAMGWLSVCSQCARDLSKNEMPRLALANWLYYARDRLPEDVAQAFREMSIFEKTLISRVRTNSILCRFSGFDPDINGAPFSNGRRHIRGNVISTPMDTIRINEVLPPTPRDITDTICALIVSHKAPSRDNIDSLSPVLVRKSRVKLLIQFLLHNNRHYKLTDTFRGFSEENLNALFTGTRSSGIPDHVNIAHIATNEAIEGGVSDHIRRFEGLEGIFMENVSYTQGDHSPQSFREMALLALQHCKSGRPFLYAKTGSIPIPDIGNPNWLSWAHPNVDPFGIGGFHEPKRKKPIGMEIQLRHMLNMRDPTFERDPELAFDVYNIIRKHAVNNTLRFCVPYTSYSRVVDDIIKMNKDSLADLHAKLQSNPNYKPNTAEEIHVLRTMSSISPVARHIPGTTAQKIKMRNEIRAIISQKGSPTLFVTLNPADYFNPIVTAIACRAKTEADLTNLAELTTSERAAIAISHPVACAQFFDSMMKSFLRIILRHGRKEGRKGIFGVCNAYYGTVETQGRGSLHCHLLIWLKGHLPPEILQSALISSERYRSELRDWLDSIMDSGLSGSRSYLNNVTDLKARDNELGKTGDFHPGTIEGPSISNMDRPSFRKEAEEFLDDLLLRFNWHGHSASCWKYLGPKDEKSGATCRFGMDGVTYPDTLIDAQTGSITIRRRNPKMTQFNPTVTLLMKCNTDVKFIGSGEDAKAFMYYVTDYITKAPLSMHAGLSALSYAIQKGEERGTLANANYSEDDARRIMTLALNSMLGRQEISQPQVMSYIAGGGENYTSERFQAFNWAEVVKYVTTASTSSQVPVDTPHDVNMSVNREEGSITVSNQLLDYIYRPESQPFQSMGLYQHIATTTKSLRKTSTESMISNRSRQTKGLPFSSQSHPQFDTRLATLRSIPVVPVLLGPRISKNKGTEAEREEWARDMCILFRPWRHPSDLRASDAKWSDSLDAFMPSVSPADRKIMENMSLISEGKSARDSRPRGKRARAAGVSLENDDNDIELLAESTDDAREINAFRILEAKTAVSGESSVRGQLNDHLSSLLGLESATAFQRCITQASPLTHDPSSPLPSAGDQTDAQSAYGASEALLLQFMALCKNRISDAPEQTHDSDADRNTEPARRSDNSRSLQHAQASITTLSQRTNARIPSGNAWAEAASIIRKRNIRDNPEQLRSFEIVAHHVIEGGPQLLMYIGGKGGTGKSYLVESIVMLFDALGISDHLRLGAPTGIAASLIGGNTLHSLLNIGPNSKGSRNEKLTRDWRAVKYLIVDEVSMVGAHFMATISSRLRTAKADHRGDSQKVFGGINIIFMGDFYQLSPPKQPSLYSHRLVRNPSFAQTRDNSGIDAMAGAFLWRQVNTVVILKQSKRHASDPLFADILERIRTCTNIIKNGSLLPIHGSNVIELLRQREITRVAASDPSELKLFQDAPVIVGSKIIRDALNASLLVAHADRLQTPVHLHYATDQVRGKDLAPALATRLRNLPTRSTNESLGILPLFLGMRVMITENISVPYKIVNGSEGIVVNIRWSLNPLGYRTADVVYVKIPGCTIEAPGIDKGIVPIFPTYVSIPYPIKIGDLSAKSFRRRQIPVVPAYSYTDYKSQGRTLERAIVDITSARGQGIYVMLSRVTTLNGLLILRWFPNNRILQRMSQELRNEVDRLHDLHSQTLNLYQNGSFAPVEPP